MGKYQIPVWDGSEVENPYANPSKGTVANEDGPSLIRLHDGRIITVSRKRPVLRRVAAVLRKEQKIEVKSPHDDLCLGLWAAVKRGYPGI